MVHIINVWEELLCFIPKDRKW